MLTLCASSPKAHAQGFPADVDPTALTPTEGIRFELDYGGSDATHFGTSISSAGDINGDGLADVILSAIGVYGLGQFEQNAGAAYVVFGSNSGFPTPFYVDSLNGTNGFKIFGDRATDYLGSAVSALGDVNGDGIDDLAVGAYYHQFNNPGGEEQNGACYIIYGKTTGFAPILDTGSLPFGSYKKIIGEDEGDRIGQHIQGVGDVNGDGINDILVAGASSRAYVVYGTTSTSSTLDLENVPAPAGMTETGFYIQGNIPGAVYANAGDFNGDGINDIVAGLQFGYNAYIVYGQANRTNNMVSLNAMEEGEGFILQAAFPGHTIGESVSGIGDFNMDGFDDVIIGAAKMDLGNEEEVGGAYVVFGSDQAFDSLVYLSSLDGTNGFVMIGEREDDRFGSSVSNLGDINGDMIPDLIVGAYFGGFAVAGAAYVMYGNMGSFPDTFDVSNLDGNLGFRLIEPAGNTSQLGEIVSDVGDFNGDGLHDILINESSIQNTGQRVYLLYGRGQSTSLSETLALTVSIFPNPSTGFIRIESQEANIEHVRLFDVAGQEIAVSLEIGRHHAQIRTPHQGLAILQVQTKKGLLTKKVVFQ